MYASETKKWDADSIRKEDKGRISGIRCQHPTCKTHPLLRRIFWVNGVPIGSICVKKGRWNMIDMFNGDE